jgi:hypothetical protein
MEPAADLVRGRCASCAKAYRIPGRGGPFRCKACGGEIVPLETLPAEEPDADPAPAEPTRAPTRAPTRERGRHSKPRSIAGRGYVLLGSLVACALADATAVWAGLAQRALLLRVEGGEQITTEVADANDEFYGNVGLAQGALYIATAVVWLVWIQRASKNQKPLGARPRYSPGWAVGGWFVPFYNLWCPLQVTRELWKTSGVAALEAVGEEHPRAPGSGLVVLWWVSWVTGNMIDVAAARRMMNAEELDELIASTSAVACSDALSIANTVFAALVVFFITRRQQAAVDRH